MVNAAENRYEKQSAIPVYGMTCEHCVHRVAKALEKLQGVENVCVSLADGKAFFPLNTALVGMEEVSRAIEDAGYSTRPAPRRRI